MAGRLGFGNPNSVDRKSVNDDRMKIGKWAKNVKNSPSDADAKFRIIFLKSPRTPSEVAGLGD
jgi:hypothetical protein